MPETKITETARAGRILISDGALGTYLQSLGLPAGHCPELWNLERPEEVRLIARSYAGAGSDIITTNSFGANRIKLEAYGLGAQAAELNTAAAKLARKEAGSGRWVMGSMGPAGKLLIMEEITEDELYSVYSEQAAALEEGGADAVCIETMTDLDEALIAVRAAKENTGCEIICTFTFDRTLSGGYRTMMGVSPAEASAALARAGADIIGANCGSGLEDMAGIIREMRAAQRDIPLIAQPNAGLPIYSEGRHIYPATPEDMEAAAVKLISAGANIIGGCCGTTPEHIKSMAEAIRG